MSKGFLQHIWYKLLDEEGVPVSGASIYIYEYNHPTTEINLFDENENNLSQPITTDSLGFFDFYVKDNIRPSSGGYPWNTKFIISWSKDDKSGVLSGDRLFGDFETVNISGSDTKLNKTISNFLGWTFEEHTNFMFGTTDRCGSSSSSSSSVSSSSSSSSSYSSSSSSISNTPLSGLFQASQSNDSLVHYDGFSASVLGTINPAESPITVTSDGTNLIIGNYFSGLVNVLNGFSITVLDSFTAVTGNNLIALAFDGTNLISCTFDGFSYIITQHDGISSSTLTSFIYSGGDIGSMAWDGTNLLVVGSNDIIYKLDGISNTVLDSINAPGTYTAGLAWDGTNVIVADNTTLLIYKLDGFSTTILDSFDFSGSVSLNENNDLTWI